MNQQEIFEYIKKQYPANPVKSVYLIATRDLSNLWLQFFYLKIKGLCDSLRKRF